MSAYIPEHIVDAFVGQFEKRLEDHTVLPRLLRPADPAKSVGVAVQNFTYDGQTYLIGSREPAVGRYQVRIQNMVKHTDEEVGRKIHNVQSALVRAILYRDPELGVRLLGVNRELEGSDERIKRFGVRRQDFLSQQISGSFTYLCVTEVYVESEQTLL